MIKKLVVMICICLLVLNLSACNYASVDKTYDPENENIQSMFVEVEGAVTWKVVYHKETKVMYVVSAGGYNAGTFTVLINADGSPMVWKEEN